jgi:predicted transcriptional regulator
VNQSNLKEEAHRLVDRLSDAATWDDLMYEIYVRQAVEAGLRDSNAGRTVAAELVRKELGLPS